MFVAKKKREVADEPQDEVFGAENWKRWRPAVADEAEAETALSDGRRKRKMPDVEPFGVWPPARSLTDVDEQDRVDSEGGWGSYELQTKRVSLDGPMILRLGEKEDDGGGRDMDWECAAAAPGPPQLGGYYPRAHDDSDYDHPYRRMNEVLLDCHLAREAGRKL